MIPFSGVDARVEPLPTPAITPENRQEVNKLDIITGVMRASLKQEQPLIQQWHFLTLEELCLVLLLKTIPYIGNNPDQFAKLFGPLSNLFKACESAESPVLDAFDKALASFKEELSKAGINDPELDRILTLLKRIQRSNGTSIYKQNVKDFLDNIPMMDACEALKSLAGLGILFSDNIRNTMARGIANAFKQNDHLLRAGSNDKTRKSKMDPINRWLRKRSESEKNTFDKIQHIRDPKNKVERLGLWLHQHKTTFQTIIKGFEDNKGVFGEEKRNEMKQGIDSMIKMLDTNVKSQFNPKALSSNKNPQAAALNFMSGILGSLTQMIDFTLKFGLEVFLSKPFQEKYIHVLSKVYDACAASISEEVAKQGSHELDWMKILDEWDAPPIDKKELEEQKKSPAKQAYIGREEVKVNLGTDPSASKKKNQKQNSVQPVQVSSTHRRGKASCEVMPCPVTKPAIGQGAFNLHLSEIEYQLRVQALVFGHPSDQQLVWFKKICYREAGYHTAVLRQAFNAFLSCSRQRKARLLEGFPLVFLRHQHLVEEHLCRFGSIDHLLNNGGAWEDLILSHSLQESARKEDAHLASLDLGTLWARYPNRYENRAISPRLKWLINNANPIAWQQQRKLRFDAASQKIVLESLARTIQNSQACCGETGFGDIAKLQLDPDMIFNPDTPIQESPLDTIRIPYLELQQIERNLLGQLADLRSADYGLSPLDKQLADRILKDVVMHASHLAWSLSLFQELDDPAFAALHVQNIIWNMQFFFEQYFEFLCIKEGYGAIEDHDLESYGELLAGTFKTLDSRFISSLNIKMSTSYMFYLKSVFDQKKQYRKALDLLLQGYRLSSDYQVTGEKAVCSADYTFKDFKLDLANLAEQFLQCALSLTQEASGMKRA